VKDLFEVARSRNLRVLLAGRLVSAGGDFVYQVALSIAIFAYAHQSSLAVSAFWIVRLAPPLVLGSPVGALADRLGYRRAMIIADVGRLALVAVMALVARPATWGCSTRSFTWFPVSRRCSIQRVLVSCHSWMMTKISTWPPMPSSERLAPLPPLSGAPSEGFWRSRD